MKRSSIFILLGIFLVYGVIQIWVIRTRFSGTQSVTTLSASFMGETVLVGTPASGIIRAVNVAEGQHVEKGQPLFSVYQQSPVDPDGVTPVTIVAQRAGSLYDITAVPDSFVQASQILAKIVDTSPEGLSVQATLSVLPEDLPSIIIGKAATVNTPSLNGGKDLRATITRVGLYDGIKKTVDIRLHVENLPPRTDITKILGLPAEVSVLLGNTQDQQ